MLFVPDIDLVVSYLHVRSKLNKNNAEILTHTIFEKNSNKVIYCRELVDELSAVIDDSNDLYDDYTLLIKTWIDDVNENYSLKIDLPSDTDRNSVFDDLCHLNIPDQIIIGVSHTKESNQYSNSILNVNNIVEYNKNYIYAKLLCKETCLLRSSQFSDITYIEELLNNVYNLYSQLDEVTIIDRHANLDHPLFNVLIRKEVLFKYYKLNANAADSNILLRKLKKYELYSTTNQDLIHERQIIINDLVINIDEDPFKLLDRNTWIVTIEYSKTISQSVIKNKCERFLKSIF